VTVVTYVAAIRKPPAEPVRLGDVLPQACDNIAGTLSADFRGKGVHYEVSLMPLAILDSTDPGRHVIRGGPRRGAPGAYGPDDFAEIYARLVSDGVLSRAVITGARACGKSTIARMIALGLAREGRVLPLVLSAGSWDGNDLHRWVEREVVTFCPELRRVSVDREHRLLKRIIDGGKAVFILDDMDELPADRREKMLAGLNRDVPMTCPLLVFSRSPLPELAGHGWDMFEVAEASPVQVRDYLQQMAGNMGMGVPQLWAPVLKSLGERRPGPLAKLLTSPLFAFLAWRVCTVGQSPDSLSPAITPGQLAALVNDKGVAAAQDKLIDAFVELRVGDTNRRRARRDQRWLRKLAREIRQRPGRSLAWWDLPDMVPQPVRLAAPTLLLVLAYPVTLHMPQGFTRGLAIGIAAGVVMGFLRGITVGSRPAITAGVLVALCIAAIGADVYGWRVGFADGTELGTAFALTVLLRPYFIAKPWQALTAAVITAAGSALTTWAALLTGGRLELGGGPLAVFGSMFTGVFLGTLAARMFTADLGDLPRPSLVDLRPDTGLRSLLLHVARAIPPVVLIGVAAAIGGVIQKSPQYGYQVLVIFGLGIGVPVALVAGLLRWLSQRLPSRTTKTVRTTFRDDWQIAVAAIAVLTITSTLMTPIMILLTGNTADTSGQAALRVPLWAGPVFGLGLGVVLASLVAASPSVLAAHAWLTLTGRLPWRLLSFLDHCHKQELLHQFGPLYEFRHDMLNDRLVGLPMERGQQ
jgi:hypothetical protein